MNKENNQKSIEIPTIQTKLKPCNGDSQKLSKEYIYSEENENEKKEEKLDYEIIQNAISERNDNDKRNSFKRKVSNIDILSKQELKPNIFRRSSSKKNTIVKEKTLAEHFKNYSEIKAKRDVMKIEWRDLIRKQNNGFLKKLEALKIATSKIKQDLDITNIMQKFQEVDKLKLILFNKEQLMLFNLIAKPEILLDEENGSEKDPGIMISQNLKNLNERSDQNFMELVFYYNKIKKKKGQDDLEGRLIKLIDSDMKKYLEI